MWNKNPDKWTWQDFFKETVFKLILTINHCTTRDSRLTQILKMKVYGPRAGSIRSADWNYTVCKSMQSSEFESIRSWIIDESYDVKAESIRSWSWFIINESYDVKSGKYTVLNLTHNRWVIPCKKRKVCGPRPGY